MLSLTRLQAIAFICLMLILPGNFLNLRAQDQPPSLQKEATPPTPTSPKALPQVLNAGTQTLEEEISSLRSRIIEEGKNLLKAQKDLQTLEVSASSLRSYLAVKTLDFADLEQLLRSYGAQHANISEKIRSLSEEMEAIKARQALRASSLSTLEEQMNQLRESATLIWSEEIQDAYQGYLRKAAIERRSSSRLLSILSSRLEVLQQQKSILDSVLPQLQRIEESWRIEVLRRQERLPLREQVMQMWSSFTALPERVQQWLESLYRSGRIGLFLRSHSALLVGLIAYIVLLGWTTRWLNRWMKPRFQIWQAESQEIGVHSLYVAAEILVSLLFPIGLTVWLGLAFSTLDLLNAAPALITLYTLATLVALRFSRRLISAFFGRRNRKGLLPLDEKTAHFYRKHLRRISIYILLAIPALMTLDHLQFPSSVQQFLRYMAEVVLLIWTLWILRKRSFEKLLPSPAEQRWARWAGAVRIFRLAGSLVVTFIILSYLLGFQSLSVFVAHSAATTELIMILWLLAGGLGREVIHFSIHSEDGWLGRRYPSRAVLLRRLCELSKQAFSVVLGLTAILIILSGWGLGPQILMKGFQWLNWGVNIGPVRLTPFTIVMTILVIYLGFWLSRFISTLLQVRIFPRTGWDIGVQYTISTILQYVILAVGVLLGLTVLGFPLANLALIMGALGVGVGLGLQDIVSNFVSGLVLLIERPIKVGDMLVIDNQWGEVKQIRMRSTVFRTYDGSVLIIPNSDLTTNKILNWTLYGRTATRVTLTVGVSYDSDVDEVTRILMEVCKANPKVMDDPPPQVFFHSYGESSLNFTVWIHVQTPSDRMPATHELNSAIFEAFRQHGIEIPFPQRDLNLKNLPEGLLARKQGL